MRGIGWVSLAAALAAGAPALAQLFPAYGADAAPQVIVTVFGGPADGCSPTDDCPTSLTFTGQPSYDGLGDAYVGVVNDASVPVTFLDFSGANLFSFTGHGLDTYGAPSNASDTTGYGGPDSYFAGPGGPFYQVQFVAELQPGQSTELSLAGLPTAVNNGVPEPGMWTLILLGFAGMGATIRRAKPFPPAED